MASCRLDCFLRFHFTALEKWYSLKLVSIWNFRLIVERKTIGAKYVVDWASVQRHSAHYKEHIVALDTPGQSSEHLESSLCGLLPEGYA